MTKGIYIDENGKWHKKERKETLLSRLWRKIKKTEPPYYYYYSPWTIISKPIRKWFSAVVVPTIPFTNLRVQCYRWCGYKIGKNVFIGMRCYLDDVCYDQMVIEDDVIISYGVYIACHGRKQGHNKLVIRKGAYVGMRASIVARHDLEIGEYSVVGAMTLVNKSVPAGKTVVGVPGRLLEDDKKTK